MPKSLSELNAEDWKIAKDLAAALYSPKEIAVALEANVSDFVDACMAEGTECYNAIMAARLETEYKLRVSIIKVANAGSVPAQSMAREMFKESKIKWNDK